jgi:Fe-S cluster biogenesis protein NfuA
VAEVEAHIQQVVDEMVAPKVRADGGDVHFESFAPESGVVTISLSGACVNCSSSTVTLRFLIKNVILHYVPEATNVVRLGAEEDDGE